MREVASCHFGGLPPETNLAATATAIMMIDDAGGRMEDTYRHLASGNES